MWGGGGILMDTTGNVYKQKTVQWCVDDSNMRKGLCT